MSGHLSALDAVTAAAVKKGALKAVQLAVSGAFHTPLMQPAREALVKVCPEGKLAAAWIRCWNTPPGSQFVLLHGHLLLFHAGMCQGRARYQSLGTQPLQK